MVHWTIQKDTSFSAKRDRDDVDGFFFSTFGTFVGSLHPIELWDNLVEPLLFIRIAMEQHYFSLNTENNNSYLIILLKLPHSLTKAHYSRQVFNHYLTKGEAEVIQKYNFFLPLEK